MESSRYDLKSELYHSNQNRLIIPSQAYPCMTPTIIALEIKPDTMELKIQTLQLTVKWAPLDDKLESHEYSSQ